MADKDGGMAANDLVAQLKEDAKYNFDCPQFTDFAAEDLEGGCEDGEDDFFGEGPGLNNKDNFFLPRQHQEDVTKDIPEEWINLAAEKLQEQGKGPGNKETDAADTENRPSESNQAATASPAPVKNPPAKEKMPSKSLTPLKPQTGSNIASAEDPALLPAEAAEEIVVDEIKLPIPLSGEKKRQLLASPQTPPEVRESILRMEQEAAAAVEAPEELLHNTAPEAPAQAPVEAPEPPKPRATTAPKPKRAEGRARRPLHAPKHKPAVVKSRKESQAKQGQGKQPRAGNKTEPASRRSRSASTSSKASASSASVSAASKGSTPRYMMGTSSTKNRLSRGDTPGVEAGAAVPAAKKKVLSTKTRGPRKAAAPTTQRAAPRLTEPKTPFLSTRLRPKKEPAPSSTTQELQRVQQDRERLRLEEEKQKQKLAKLREGSGPVQAVKKSLTVAESPQLQINRRPWAAKQDEDKAKSKLRQQDSRPTATGRGPVKLTHPKPFRFATDSRVKQHQEQDEALAGEEGSPFVPMAQKVQQFQSKTPARFRHSNKVELPEKAPLKLTEPEAPRFASDTRIRGSTFKSAEEQEKEMMEHMEQFKARPLPKHIMESTGEMGVPKVEKKAPVVPKGFSFQTDKRAMQRHKPSTPTPSSQSAVAGPRRIQAHRRRDSTPARPQPPKLTVVQPFKFSTDVRAASRPLTPASAPPADFEPPAKFTARPMPDFTKPAQLPHVERKAPVEAEPFKLQSLQRHEEAQRKLEEQRRKEEEDDEKARSFKAQPVHIPEEEPQIPVSHKPLTDPKTPMTLQRSLLKQAEREEENRRIREEEQHRANFHAKPLPKTTYEKDFSPERPGTVTDVLDIKLHSDVQAEKRQAFEAHMHEKEAAELREKELADKLRVEEEERAVREHRKQLQFKAKPVPNYAAMAAAGAAGHPATPPRLTQPESPFLETKQKYGPK